MSWLYKSDSGWEDSYFGGFVRILIDYPELKIPWEIDTETPPEHTKSLTSYTRDKLLGLFQMKIAEYSYLTHFLNGASIITKQSWLGKDKYYLTPAKSQIIATLDHVIKMDTELASLFDHYRKLITFTDFFYPYNPSPSSGESDESEEGEEEEQEGTDEGENEGEDEKEGEQESEEKKKEKGKGKEGEEGEEKDEKKNGKGGKKDDGDEKKDEDGNNDGEKAKPHSKQSGRNITGGEGTGHVKVKLDIEQAKKQAARNIVEIVQRKKWYSYDDPISGDHKSNTKFSLMTKELNAYRYKKDETLYASHLLAMLDISFDPTSDKLPNLRNGKLDTGKIGSVPAGNHHVYYTIEENQTTRPFSICILADESGSMRQHMHDDRSPHMMQNKILKILYKCFSQIIPPNKIYIYGHSGHSSPVVRIYNDNYNQNFEYTIERQTMNEYGNNYDGPVIECVYERVRGVTNDNIIFISISDGQPSGHDYGGGAAMRDLKRVIEKCKRDGFVTCGVGVNYGHVKEIYSYHTIVTDIMQMPKQVSLLINQVVKTEFQG